MDESYLTGEPYRISKTPGTTVLSGAINGETALTVRADKLAVDSRYAKIMLVMRASEQRRPHLRRLGDQLGAFYTPLAVAIAIVAWAISGEALRFLAVLVVATPCPLLIAIPVAIISAISLAARRGIIIKDPAVLEKIVRQATSQANTVFLGDGINDAPALTAATVGLAFGQNSDITAEAAGAVILESSLQKVDEFLHLSRRLRRIALESAVGGMALSVLGMALAAVGYLPPVAGAIVQEIIDVVAVVNALRVAWPPRSLTDYAVSVPGNRSLQV